MMAAADTTSVRDDTKNYRKLFMAGRALIDVRAPVEFLKGSVPGAVNLALMTDSEREAVGIAYKNEGQEAAVALGHTLVQGVTKSDRVSAWAAFAAKNPRGYLFCMRGGMRSQISQRWMLEAGSPYPLVTGGYKALRRFLIEELGRLIAQTDFIIVAGRTGTGKTDFLGAVSHSLDLEGLANHRGSSFGRRIGDQPSQINFENALAVALMKLTHRADGQIFIEDESRRIGALEVPPELAAKMSTAPVVLIEEPLDARVDIIHRDYVSGMREEYDAFFGEKGGEEHATFLLEALARIKKRLGGARYQDLDGLMQQAFETQQHGGSDAAHRIWISRLLTDYYDPMYEYQLGNHGREILFSGRRADAVEWARTRN